MHTTERYQRTSTARTLYRTGLTTADSKTTMDTPLLSGALLRGLVGRPTLAVGVEFATASDTCVLAVLTFDKSADAYVLTGMQKVTATADATARKTASGNYLGAPLLLDTLGATHYEVRLYTAGAGAVDLRAWEY